jgi:hypothetical protein
MNTSRSELAAAIIASTDVEPAELERLVLDYRGKRVREVMLDVGADADVVELPRHGPGRRSD